MEAVEAAKEVTDRLIKEGSELPHTHDLLIKSLTPSPEGRPWITCRLVDDLDLAQLRNSLRTSADCCDDTSDMVADMHLHIWAAWPEVLDLGAARRADSNIGHTRNVLLALEAEEMSLLQAAAHSTNSRVLHQGLADEQQMMDFLQELHTAIVELTPDTVVRLEKLLPQVCMLVSNFFL